MVLEDVVEGTVAGRISAAGEAAYRVNCLHELRKGGFGSSIGGDDVDDVAVVVGDKHPPLGFVLVVGDLKGDIGDDRCHAGDLDRLLVEPGQGGEVDADVDQSPPLVGGVGSEKKIDGDVGAQLVVSARVPILLE